MTSYLDGLRGAARDAAQKAVDHGLVLTSGLRSPMEQAAAMAANVVQDRDWVARTYVQSSVRDDLVAMIAKHWPLAQLALQLLIFDVLTDYGPDDLHHLSWHLSGDAFDVKPTGNEADEQFLLALVVSRIQAGGMGKLLTHEGSLTRLHVQLV